ncbi:MAG: hypothetical protein B6I31_02805 [Desulfobacteraceae bacterium 4572_19]|nr:MAG: hypothetical protein B6I31_02805 [Desulfobacteraceae bacterium 4572_19]
MEQVRLITAIVLSCLVFFCWNYFFTPEQNITQQTTKTADKVSDAEHGITSSASKNKSDITLAESSQTGQNHSLLSSKNSITDVTKASSKLIQDAKTVTIDTPLYTVEISEAGAVVTSFFLKKYRETFANEDALKQMVTEKSGTVILGFSANGIDGLQDAVFSAHGATGPVSVNEGTREVIFSWKSNDGFTVEKVFTFSANSYMIKYDVVIKNNSDRSFQDELSVTKLRNPACSLVLKDHVH